MEYFYKEVSMSRNGELLSQVNAAASRLRKKLSPLELDQLGISEYNQRYFGTKLKNYSHELQRNNYLLMLSLAGNKLPLSQFTFIDYGGGSGMMSLLAKELGIGRVIYNDIYDVSCNDVQKIARAADVAIDDYVCGGIDELLDYIRDNSLTVNAITSYDVIEHIYDIEEYIGKLPLLSSSSFRVVFGSGANIKNPRIRRMLRKKHLEFEYNDRKKVWGHKERDTLKNFLEIRRDIVSNYAPELCSDIVEKIAKSTRGLMKSDVEKYVDEYKEKGEITYKPDDLTNTCDPYTGNWAEHLMRTEWLESVFKDEGFNNIKILSGYYSNSGSLYEKLIKRGLNVPIRYAGARGLFFSPYYIVYADYYNG